MAKNYPLVSVITPTLNAQSVLGSCLKSVSEQDYPKDKIEIIIADGGSTDHTLDIARKYNAKIVSNPLKTAEAGKAVALKHVRGELVALIDSDNILPDSKWLKQMVEPLLIHKEAVGSEPWSYTYRKKDSFITRYCALIGMNDPLVHFLGNYDRMNMLTGKWTEVGHEEVDYKDYLLVTFKGYKLPTIGANGTLFRTEFLNAVGVGDYLFDIDILAKELKVKGLVNFIKVKNGIIHTFCESNIPKFAKKQRRRVKDFLYYKSLGIRDYDWESSDGESENMFGLAKFILSCLTVFPLFVQAFIGYSRKRDRAWFFHPLACELTLWEYAVGRILSFVGKKEMNRLKWRQ